MGGKLVVQKDQAGCVLQRRNTETGTFKRAYPLNSLSTFDHFLARLDQSNCKAIEASFSTDNLPLKRV